MTRVFISLIPPILERLKADLEERFDGVTVNPPMDHCDMDHFFDHVMGGADDPYDLVVSGYPKAMATALASPAYGPITENLPPMRKELRDIGLTEPDNGMKVICAFPLVLVYSASLNEPPRAWADLCRTELIGKTVIPPADSPVPDFFDCFMSELVGEEAKPVIQAVKPELYPWDINQAIAQGRFLAGLNIPVLAKDDMGGKVGFAWPREGAITEPTCAMLKKDASPQARELLTYLFNPDVQGFLSLKGEYLPVIQNAPLFGSMIASGGNLHFDGWEKHLKLGS